MKIIRDTREQKGWTFGGLAVDGKLDTGDYTLEGLENILCVERKGSIGEWAGNLTEPRFERELARMKPFPLKYIICEFELRDVMAYPHNMGRLADKIKVTGAYLLRRSLQLSILYNVDIVYCGKFGEEYCLSLFKRATEWAQNSVQN